MHIGPMAQDFHSLFQTGNDEKSISAIDPSGIALAGIQALLDKIKELEEQINKLNEQRNMYAASSKVTVKALFDAILNDVMSIDLRILMEKNFVNVLRRAGGL